MYVCMYIYINICTYVHIYLHMYTQGHKSTYIYICTYTILNSLLICRALDKKAVGSRAVKIKTEDRKELMRLRDKIASKMDKLMEEY